MKLKSRTKPSFIVVLAIAAFTCGGVADQESLALPVEPSRPFSVPADNHPPLPPSMPLALTQTSSELALVDQLPLAQSPPALNPEATPPSGLGVGICPSEMVLVEGRHCGEFDQECLQWDDPGGQPAKRVCARFRKPSVCKGKRHRMRYCIDKDEYVAPADSLPIAGVTWEHAHRICASLGKRLCSAVEWEFACEGEDGLPYPYGYERAPALCNQDRLSREGWAVANGDLREPAHATCVSPFGVRDMVGNVDEWVVRRMASRTAQTPRRSELRGGWWMTGRNRCRANTNSHDERYAGRQTGVRCCRDADKAPQN